MKKKLTQKDLDKIKPENWDVLVETLVDDFNEYKNMGEEELKEHFLKRYNSFIPKKPIRTLLFLHYKESSEFTIVEGDWTRFHNLKVNDPKMKKLEAEFSELFFTGEKEIKYNFTTDKSLIENKQWDVVAIVTWLP